MPQPCTDVHTENPVVKLCIEGMAAEGHGRLADAGSLFARAWELRQDDYDACIAAHCVARHQPTPEDTLHWNQEALARALLADYQRIHGFFPSLYLNLGHSYEVLGDRSTASHYYDMAGEHLGEADSVRDGDVVRRGIAEGRRRNAEHD